MSVEYTIAAIPTLYRGRMYRSRLEARWAAFFDRLGWEFEYEPFDLGPWSPDFLLRDFDILVEVKPLTKFDDDVAEKVNKATDPHQRVLITWVSPQKIGNTGLYCLGAYKGEHSTTPPNGGKFLWDGAVLYWRIAIDTPSIDADICVWHDKTHYSLSRRERFDGLPRLRYPEYIARLWADASNAVQWEAKS